jgi:hypothetical protein
MQRVESRESGADDEGVDLHEAPQV